MKELLAPTMILFCKAIKFAVEEVVLIEICVKICKNFGKFAQNGQEKTKAISCGNPGLCLHVFKNSEHIKNFYDTQITIQH